MLSGIDHVVVLVRDLPRAMADYADLGFSVTPGGQHAGGATHNALIGFEDGSYFELIAFTDPSREQDHRWWPRLAAGEGLVDYALRADKVSAVIEEAHSRGLELGKATDGARRRPDGQQIAWRSVTSGRAVGTTALPFAIEDVTRREARVPGGDAAKHGLNVRGIAEIRIAVRDVERATRDLKAMLGGDPENMQASVAGANAEASFMTASHRLRLLQPGAATTHDGVGLSLAEHLELRGEGPYEVLLELDQGSDQQSGQLLPVTESHGVRIRIGPSRQS